MVSTFTPSKALEQPARGDDVGTWDTPVNGNMDIIDRSFGQTATIVLAGSDYVLASSEYQCVFIQLTGILTASVSVVLPQLGSFYVFQNLTTGGSGQGFQVILTTNVAFSHGIAAPPGAPFMINCDGIDTRYVGGPTVGVIVNHIGTSLPSWMQNCTVKPYLLCDGSGFSASLYPGLYKLIPAQVVPTVTAPTGQVALIRAG